MSSSSKSGTATAVVSRPETERSTKSEAPVAWQYLAGRILESCDFTRVSGGDAYTNGSFVVACVSPKAAEVARQVDRLKQAKEFADSRGEQFDADGLASSILFLQNLTTGPIPVPVASWDIESGPSLFFSDEDFYGDLEVNGNTIEYLLRWNDTAGTQEVYDSEEIESGRIPPRLLMHLFASFARSNVNMP